MELERDPDKKNGVYRGEANSDSDADFEYVSGIAMYRVLWILHVLQSRRDAY